MFEWYLSGFAMTTILLWDRYPNNNRASKVINSCRYAMHHVCCFANQERLHAHLRDRDGEHSATSACIPALKQPTAHPGID